MKNRTEPIKVPDRPPYVVVPDFNGRPHAFVLPDLTQGMGIVVECQEDAFGQVGAFIGAAWLDEGTELETERDPGESWAVYGRRVLGELHREGYKSTDVVALGRVLIKGWNGYHSFEPEEVAAREVFFGKAGSWLTRLSTSGSDTSATLGASAN